MNPIEAMNDRSTGLSEDVREEFLQYQESATFHRGARLLEAGFAII